MPAQPNPQAQYMAHHYQAYQQQMNRLNPQQNPSASPTPMNAAQVQAAAAAIAAQRSSPMTAAQSLTARSPMPQQQAGQQMTHPTQQSYSYALNQYNAQMRPGVPHVAHPQLVPHHLANGATNATAAAGQGTQDQQAHPAHPAAPLVAQYQAAPMFSMNYQMGMNMGGLPPARMPPGYWPVSGVGRGMPIASGQHQMPGMAGHPQQLGTAGKASGMQGS